MSNNKRSMCIGCGDNSGGYCYIVSAPVDMIESGEVPSCKDASTVLPRSPEEFMEKCEDCFWSNSLLGCKKGTHLKDGDGICEKTSAYSSDTPEFYEESLGGVGDLPDQDVLDYWSKKK